MSDQPDPTAEEETDRRIRDLAREAGAAYQRAFGYATRGGDAAVREAAEYAIAYRQVPADGLYRRGDDGLEWVDPTAENCQIRVAVTDADDGRFLPGLAVRATLRASDGSAVGPVDLPFAWHPEAYYYGRNVTVPGDGTYDLEVEVAPADDPRCDRERGDRFADSASVTYEGVAVTCGQR